MLGKQAHYYLIKPKDELLKYLENCPNGVSEHLSKPMLLKKDESIASIAGGWRPELWELRIKLFFLADLKSKYQHRGEINKEALVQSDSTLKRVSEAFIELAVFTENFFKDCPITMETFDRWWTLESLGFPMSVEVCISSNRLLVNELKQIPLDTLPEPIVFWIEGLIEHLSKE